jgi:hypothetical protein
MPGQYTSVDHALQTLPSWWTAIVKSIGLVSSVFDFRFVHIVELVCRPMKSRAIRVGESHRIQKGDAVPSGTGRTDERPVIEILIQYPTCDQSSHHLKCYAVRC